MTPALTQPQLIALFNSLQSLAPTLPNEAALVLSVLPTGGGKITAELSGAWYGDEASFNGTFGSFVAGLPAGTTKNVTSMNWLQGLVAIDGPLSTSAPDIVSDGAVYFSEIEADDMVCSTIPSSPSPS